MYDECCVCLLVVLAKRRRETEDRSGRDEDEGKRDCFDEGAQRT